jgi:hypothetical protein
MLAQDNPGTRTLRSASDHALKSTVCRNSFGCLVISPLCAKAVRRCGAELNRRERDAWLLEARLHHQMSGPGPTRTFRDTAVGPLPVEKQTMSSLRTACKATRNPEPLALPCVSCRRGKTVFLMISIPDGLPGAGIFEAFKLKTTESSA